MNKNQKKILFTKILPRAIIIGIIVIGIISLIFSRIWMENENQKAEKWLKSDEGKEKLKKVLNKESEKTETKLITEFKHLNHLKIPLLDWKITIDKKDNHIELQNIVLNKNDNIISILSTTNEYITDLKEYSKFQNEKFVRNMKPSGLILNSTVVVSGYYNNKKSITEKFNAYHKPTEKHLKFQSVNFKIGKYFYTIFYNYNSETQQIVNNIEIQ